MLPLLELPVLSPRDTIRQLHCLQAYDLGLIQSCIFPRFKSSYGFFLYKQMQYITCHQPPVTRDSFLWLKALGRGGYGMVYAAQKIDTGKLYAIKCMGTWFWLQVFAAVLYTSHMPTCRQEDGQATTCSQNDR
jgi:hypothetical protein